MWRYCPYMMTALQRAAAPCEKNTKPKLTTTKLHMAGKKKVQSCVCFLVTSNFNLALPDTIIFHVVHLTQGHTVSPPHAYTVYLIRVIVHNFSQLLPLSLFVATLWSYRPCEFCGFPLSHFARPPTPAVPLLDVVAAGWWGLVVVAVRRRMGFQSEQQHTEKRRNKREWKIRELSKLEWNFVKQILRVVTQRAASGVKTSEVEALFFSSAAWCIIKNTSWQHAGLSSSFTAFPTVFMHLQLHDQHFDVRLLNCCPLSNSIRQAFQSCSHGVWDKQCGLETSHGWMAGQIV